MRYWQVVGSCDDRCVMSSPLTFERACLTATLYAMTLRQEMIVEEVTDAV